MTKQITANRERRIKTYISHTKNLFLSAKKAWGGNDDTKDIERMFMEYVLLE
jgi:hypothetical protein